MTTKDERIAWENLANGIIVQAVNDYEKAYTAYLRDPLSVDRQMAVDSLRVFFRSDWFRRLTKIDGYYVRRKIEKRCEEKRGH